jgi:chromosome segregation ATPase
MKVRKGTSVAQTQQALEEAQAVREKLAEEIAAAHGRRHQLAEDVNAYEAGEAEISRLQSEHRRQGLLVARREADVEEARKAAARSTWETAGKELKQAYGPRRAASEAVGSALAVLNRAVAALRDERDRVKPLEDKFRALMPQEIDAADFPAGRDEIPWGRLEDDVVEQLRGGARTPEADAAEANADRAEKERQAVEARVPGMVERILRGGESRERFEHDFLAIDDVEQAEALRQAEASLSDVEDEIRDRYRHPLSAFPPDSTQANSEVERVIAMIRERISGLRDLAAVAV